ncbi:MAG: hypothetical protein M3347_13185, partial [Armatimonadota bacterium]|nr:hypothetical protein [Armatimonadota bacterium]
MTKNQTGGGRVQRLVVPMSRAGVAGKHQTARQRRATPKRVLPPSSPQCLAPSPHEPSGGT